MKTIANLSLLFTAALAPSLATAEGLAITGKIGTLGLGAELTSRISDDWNGRLGFNAYNYSWRGSESGIAYDFKLKLATLSALADYYPFRGSGFRLSLGLMYNGNEATMKALPSAGNTYEINGVPYAAADIGSLHGKMTFNKAAPYVGIGWGNPVTKNVGWTFAADLGALYQGKPSVSLSATCGAAMTAAQCTALQNDVANERAQVASAVAGFRWWPVVSISASYRF